MSEKISLPISIIIAGIIIGGSIYINTKTNKPSINQKETNENIALDIRDTLRPIDVNDHILGNPKARIVIVEYSDTECPYCKEFHKTLQTIMQEYGEQGKVAWVYRHFPMEELHSKAIKEAEATECANEIGGKTKFWEYINKLYEITPSNNNLDPKELTRIASLTNIDTKKFEVCLNSGQYKNRILSDIKNAQEIGASGTPYSVLIDTKKNDYYQLEGGYPYIQLKSAIELILQS